MADGVDSGRRCRGGDERWIGEREAERGRGMERVSLLAVLCLLLLLLLLLVVMVVMGGGIGVDL